MARWLKISRAKRCDRALPLFVLGALGLVALALSLAGCVRGTAPSTDGKPAPATSASPAAPAEFAAFARALQATSYRSQDITGTAYWPTYVPAGFALESVETTTLGESPGPICDVVFKKGELMITLTQGSPVMRDFEITATDHVPWATGTAVVLPSDPEQGLREWIVYDDQRNLADMGGDVPLSELRKMAASMKPVP